MHEMRLSIEPQSLNLPASVRNHPRFESFADLGGREYGFGVQVGSEYWLHVHGVGSFLFRHGELEVKGFPDSSLDPASFRDAFFHGVAPWLLQRAAWDCLHASAVLEKEGVLVFCGPSHRGKSTMCGAWAREGAVLYGDDAVAFVIRGAAALAARLPQRVRLRGPSESWFRNAPNPAAELPGGLFVRYDLSATLKPIRAVFWMDPLRPAAEKEAALLTRLNPTEAFPLLLAGAHCMTMSDAACNRKMVDNYLSLARLAPCFRLSVVADLGRLPAAVERIRQTLAEPASV